MEVDKGFVRRRRGLPWSVPAVARRTNATSKGVAVDGAPQRWRCMAGCSDGEGGVSDEMWEMPAAPDANMEKTELPELRWISLQSVMEGGTCVADGTRLVGGGRVRRDQRREGLVPTASRVRDGAVERRVQGGGCLKPCPRSFARKKHTKGAKVHRRALALPFI